MIVIDWARVGPERPPRIELPPVPMRLNGYVMDFDETIGEIVFLTGAGYEGFGEAWSWNGSRWKQRHAQKISLEGEGYHRGYYDPSRGGMVAFRFGYDYGSETHRPKMILVTADGSREVITRGEHPIGPEGFNDVRGAFGYDRSRGVGVCVTHQGVWELDADDAWRKRATLTEKDVAQEWKDDCGSVWDPVRQKLVFWIYESDEYTHVFYEWDGETFTALPLTGLPLEKNGLREFHIGLFNPSANIAGHAEHGVVLVDGSHFWRFDGTRWSSLDAESPPPRLQKGRLAYDPKRDALVLGPGYHEGDGGGRDMQQLFYELRDGVWSSIGVKMEDSPVEDLYGKHLYFTCREAPYVVTIRGLQTYGWRDGAWTEVVEEKKGDSIVGKARVGGVIGMGDHALAVLTNGTICRFDGMKWTKTEESIPGFKERTDFTLTRVGDTQRLVLWGGAVKNRKSNDTFFRDDERTWRKHRKASPRPKDFAHEHGPYVDFDAVWDSTLDRVVRLGWDECFTLEDEIWKAWTPVHYQRLAGSRTREHFPVHDPTTGETLLINLEEETVVRFDLKRCVQVATLGLPHDEIGPERQHDSATWSKLEDDLWYEPWSRTLRAQFKEDKWAQYAWDLGPAFEAAAAMGERTCPEPVQAKPKSTKAKKAEPAPVVSARLYSKDGTQLWYCDAEESSLVRTWGPIGGKLKKKSEKKKTAEAASAAAIEQIAKKRDEGWVDASKLKLRALGSLAAVESREIEVGKALKRAPSNLAISRIGGLPSGVSAKRWPSRGDEPMGFLFQIDTKGVLKKHAGAAVFCTTDGHATEDESNTAVVLLTPAKWNAAPAKAPRGVTPLAVRKLKLGTPKLEVLEERVQSLAAEDPELGSRVDELQASSKVHESVPWSKVGGPPAWVQDGELGDDWILVAQLDFDGISLRKEWEDAGLFGVIYVVVRKNEKDAVAFWQYT